jgi:hypothetical protein
MENNNQLDPPPDELRDETNKKMWLIEGYKIWATNYQEALVLLAKIKAF